MDYSNTAVIIPCYNEALTIGKVVDDFHRELPGAVVYVYDTTLPMTLRISLSSTGLRCATSPGRAKATCAAKCSVMSMPNAT